MDFRLYARVLWRFKPIVVLGLLLAVALAVLSVVHVTRDGVTYRDAELWSSTTRLGVTQKGFPWGRLLATEQTTEQTPGEAARSLGIPLADPNRLNALTVLYAELATSDPVRRLMLLDGVGRACEVTEVSVRVEGTRGCGKIIADPVVGGESRIQLPLIDLTAIATSPLAARDLAQRSADAFGAYMRAQQLANKVPTADRVIVQQLVRPQPPKIFQGRSKTMPIVVFLAVMMAAIGLAFLLENVRPRSFDGAADSPARGEGQADVHDASRRTA